jgi:RNase P protein component
MVSRPIDVVVVARPGIAGATTTELAEEIRSLLARQGMIAP